MLARCRRLSESAHNCDDVEPEPRLTSGERVRAQSSVTPHLPRFKLCSTPSRDMKVDMKVLSFHIRNALSPNMDVSSPEARYQEETSASAAADKLLSYRQRPQSNRRAGQSFVVYSECRENVANSATSFLAYFLARAFLIVGCRGVRSIYLAGHSFSLL